MKYYSHHYWKNHVFTIISDSENILNILFGKYHLDECKYENSLIIKETIKQLEEYFSGKRKIFDLPVKICGKPFEKRVLSKLIKVGYGKTISYKELARNAGNEKAFRAVGTICKNNKIPIIIPCHRVIKSDGGLGEYAGGINLKKELLKLESSLE